MPRIIRARNLIAVVVVTAALVCLIRSLNFAHGPVAGATPAAGVALAAGLWLGFPGAIASGLGFFVGGVIARIPIEHAIVIGICHIAAAAAGAATIRALCRRPNRSRSYTEGQFIYLAGAGVFIAVVALIALTAAAVGFITLDVPVRFVAVIGLFEPLGLVTVFPVIAHAREWREVAANPWPLIPIVGFAGTLIAILAYVLKVTGPEMTAGATLVVSMPFCLWMAMRGRTLDGAAVALVASHLVLYLVLRDVGSVLNPAYLLTALYLNLLMITTQFVHSVNRDRLAALAQVAAQREELETRVIERTARLAAMTERARAADAAKSRLITTVNHEVRSPLNGVIGMASVMLAKPLDPPIRANIEIIRRSGFDLLDVINRVVDYAELGEAAPEGEIEDFDIRALVEEVIDEDRLPPFTDAVPARIQIAPGPIRRHGQPLGLRRVLASLIGNALKFTDEGFVMVRVGAESDGMTRIEVIDTGPGVPPDLRERIFQPFERGPGAAARSQGAAGLGLAISSEIVARMGGRIGVSGASDKGSCFWVELPLPAAGHPAPSARGSTVNA